MTHVLIDAGPGSGKTTTLINAYKFLTTGICNTIVPTQEQTTIFYTLKELFTDLNSDNTVFIAFNTQIKLKLAKELPPGAHVYTFNGLGQSIVFRKHRFQALDKQRGEKLLSELLGKPVASFPFLQKREYILTLRFISHMKEELLAPSEQSLNFIKEKYGYETVPKDIGLMERLMKIMSVPNKQTFPKLENSYEFIDQVWMALGCIQSPLYKYAIVDEGQDLSVLRTELVLRVAENTLICGDGFQSINAFAGADPEAFNRIKSIAKVVLPLKVCFRCPPNHIEDANQVRPARIIPYKIEPGPIERTSLTLFPQKIKELQEVIANSEPTWKGYVKPSITTDQPILVVARTNASLIKIGLHLLKARIRSCIIRRKDEDQDITQMVLGYIKSTKATNIPDLKDRCLKDISKAAMMGFKAGSRLSDTATCVLQLAAEANTIPQIESLIGVLSEEKVKTIRLSTIHKAKGLEAPIVFIAFPPVQHPKAIKPQDVEQEKNLTFVSETRSMWYKGYIGEE